MNAKKDLAKPLDAIQFNEMRQIKQSKFEMIEKKFMGNFWQRKQQFDYHD